MIKSSVLCCLICLVFSPAENSLAARNPIARCGECPEPGKFKISADARPAVCRECAESFGVNIKLKDGNQVSGYISWYPEQLPMSVLIEKLNLSASEGIPLILENNARKSLVFYKDFEKILYPVKTYVPTNEDTVLIQFSEIARIESNPKLSIKINTSGMLGNGVFSVPAKYIQELNKEPIYIVSETFYDFWTNYFIAVSSNANPVDILKASDHSKGFMEIGEILGGYGYYGLGQLECVSKKKEDISICQAATAVWEQLRKESEEVYQCQKRRSEIGDSDKARNACYSLQDKITEKYKSKFRKQPLAGFIQVRLGVTPTLFQ